MHEIVSEMRSLLQSERFTPGVCVDQRDFDFDFDFDFDGELSDSGYLPPPIRFFVGIRWVIGQGTFMARAAVTANQLNPPPGQGLKAEEIE